MQQVLGGGVFFSADHEDADDRKHDSDGRYHHGGKHVVEPSGESRAKSCRRQNRTAVRFVEVGPHACHVTHVVAYVVGNGSRVPGVIFGNARFHFAHEVGTHVGCLGVNSAAHTGK